MIWNVYTRGSDILPGILNERSCQEAQAAAELVYGFNTVEGVPRKLKVVGCETSGVRLREPKQETQ